MHSIYTPSLTAHLWLSWQQKNRSRECTPPSSTLQLRHESGRGLFSLQRDAPQLHASLEIPAHRHVARANARTHARMPTATTPHPPTPEAPSICAVSFPSPLPLFLLLLVFSVPPTVRRARFSFGQSSLS